MFLVITEGFGWKNLSQLEPNLSLDNFNTPSVFVLTFFVIALVIFGVGCIVYYLTMVVILKYPPPFVNFIDLCTVANMSVIIFNEDLRGYYIHGKSPSGAADVNSERLRLNLLSEANGNAMIRGIAPSLSEN